MNREEYSRKSDEILSKFSPEFKELIMKSAVARSCYEMLIRDEKLKEKKFLTIVVFVPQVEKVWLHS